MGKANVPLSRSRKRSARSRVMKNLNDKKKRELCSSLRNIVEGCYNNENEFRNSEESVLPPLIIEKDQNPPPTLDEIVVGRRIVNLAYLLKEYEKQIIRHPLKCTMGQMRPVKEIRRGLYSSLKFYCDACEKFLIIGTDSAPDKKDVNEAAVWGSLSTELGLSQLQELFGILDIPCMVQNTFMKYTNKISNNWQNYLQSEMKEAGQEEKRFAIEKGNVTADGIPYITVIGDGGWSKRSYGHGYNASSGVGIIIGAVTKKPLFVGVRNKFCNTCTYYNNKKLPTKNHLCTKNFSGPSTAMEYDIIIEGFSSSLEQHGLLYKYFIGDGDSNVYAKIKEKVSYGREVIKIECANHMTRNVNDKLHKLLANTKLPLEHRKILKQTTNGISNIERLVKGVRTAVKKHKGNPEMLRQDLKNAPYHVFGEHENCSPEFCKRKKAGEISYVTMLKSSSTFDLISKFEKTFGMKVRKCGLFVDANYGFLGASPDGVVEPDGLLEIKCIPSIGNEKFAETEKKNLCFNVVDGKIILKRNHAYYYQVQGQLNIAKKKYCYFVLYADNDFNVERIPVDINFWEVHMVPKLINFYTQFVVPEILDGRIPRGMTVRDSPID